MAIEVKPEVVSPSVALRWPLSDAQFAELCRLNPDLCLEYTSTGDLIIMPPTGGETSERNARPKASGTR